VPKLSNSVKNGTIAPAEEPKYTNEGGHQIRVIIHKMLIFLIIGIGLVLPGYKIGEEISLSCKQKSACIDFTTMEMNTNNEITIGDFAVTTEFMETGTRAALDLTTETFKGEVPIEHQAMRDFLAKPVMITSGTWTTGGAINADLYTINITNQLASQAIWVDKFRGNRLIRATAVIRVELNGNPFQQGLLRLWYYPDLEPANLATRNLLRESKFMAPGVMIDVRNSSAELKIPYISPFAWYDTKISDFTWGLANLTSMTLLRTGSGGALTVPYSIYLSFEDAEFAGPACPQMEGAVGPRPKIFRPDVCQMESTRAPRLKRSVKRSKEGTAANTGPITEALRLSSKVTDSLSKVPMIGTAGTTASWVLNAAAGVASVFGWSKPTMESAPMNMQPAFNRYMGTSDGLDTAVPLGLITDRKVSNTDRMSVYDGDEMSTAFLYQQPGLLAGNFGQNFTWSTTHVSGDLLYTLDVSPSVLGFASTISLGGHTVSITTGPPVYYLGTRFSLWRGTVCFQLELAKTDFHTGRLEITFTPGTGSFTSPDTTTSAYSLREILDVSNSGSICLELPYLVADQYLATSTPSGRLNIRVLNPLRCPETASGTVDGLIIAAGGSNFELACPKNRGVKQTFKAQMEGTVSDKKVEAGGILCGGSTLDTTYASESIGELFSSVKQLLNRNNRVFSTAAPFSATQYNINPWFTCTTSLTGAGVIQGPVLGGDMQSFIMMMYGYYKGDARLTMVPSTSAASAAHYNPNQIVVARAETMYVPTNGIYESTGASIGMLTTTVNWPYVDETDGSCSVSVVQNNMGAFSVLTPYLSKAKASRVSVTSTTSPATVDKSTPCMCVCVNSPSIGSTTLLYRSFADDFQLMYYVGCPPVITGYA
jgi:hypothetical protein